MTRFACTLGLVTAITLLSTANVLRADSAKFPVKGLIKSGSQSGTPPATLTVISATADPSTGSGGGSVLVLSQACFQVGTGVTATLTAGSISVPFTYANANGGTACLSFEPGYVISEGTDVTCTATGSVTFTCSASGVVTKKK